MYPHLVKKVLEIYRGEKPSKYGYATSQNCIYVIHISAGTSMGLDKKQYSRNSKFSLWWQSILLWLVTNTLKCAPRHTCHSSHFGIKFSFYTMNKSNQCFCYHSRKLILQFKLWTKTKRWGELSHKSQLGNFDSSYLYFRHFNLIWELRINYFGHIFSQFPWLTIEK